MGGYILKDKLFWYGGFNPLWTVHLQSRPTRFMPITRWA